VSSPPGFDTAPFLVIWEVTRACGLACRHCRAEAQATADPGELSTGEGIALLRRLRSGFGPVLVVLTGGDPLERADLAVLIAAGTEMGLRMALTPSATPRLTRAALADLQAAGLSRVALSLDGATPDEHDAFRGVPDTFARTIQALDWARELGLSRQINSSIHRGNAQRIPQLAELAAWAEVDLWSVFFLVPTGRAEAGHLLSPAEHERAYRQLAALALDPATPYAIKTTAGQPYYRVLAQERQRRGLPPAERTGLRAPGGVNDGKGFLFVSHTGDLHPSGFLPLFCGNVRSEDPVTVYREHPVFRDLRSPEKFGGKCGRCEYNRICGGSRSRAYGLTGDPLAADPTCVYQPIKCMQRAARLRS
jgi:radical SAM protein